MQTSNPVFAQFDAARAAAGARHTLDALADAEYALALELARSPCKNDDEFFAKAAYLLEWETANHYGGEPTMHDEFGAVLVALSEHLKRRKV